MYVWSEAYYDWSLWSKFTQPNVDSTKRPGITEWQIDGIAYLSCYLHFEDAKQTRLLVKLGQLIKSIRTLNQTRHQVKLDNIKLEFARAPPAELSPGHKLAATCRTQTAHQLYFLVKSAKQILRQHGMSSTRISEWTHVLRMTACMTPSYICMKQPCM
jgi:hypothetical protein